MRIIAGKHKGRRIELGKAADGIVRPTSDFARQAIFNILAHSAHGNNGHTFIDKHVLDVFCGTGAFGLEALSRGAKSVTFIDQSREALSVARANAEHVREMDNADFVCSDATKLPRARKQYSLVFLDPPYFSNLIPNTLKSLKENGWLAHDAVIVTEHDVKELIAPPAGFATVDSRRYGRAVLDIIVPENVPA